MLIEYYEKIVYGKMHYYPLNQNAKAVCRILERPTLTVRHLKLCAENGWQVSEKKA